MTSSSQQQTPWYDPKYPRLSDDLTGKAAVEGQIVVYPNVVRSNTDPPIAGQRICNMSFMVLQKPMMNPKSGKMVYGFVKNRGNWSDVDLAKAEASKLIRKVDSKFKIFAAQAGAWVPFSEDPIFSTGEDIDVKTSENEIALRDAAMREKEAEQERIMRELRENEDLAKKGDIYDDPESLKYYSMKRVTVLRLMEERDKYLKHLEYVRESLDRTINELQGLEASHPDFRHEWGGCYNAERRRSGLPDYIPEEKYTNEYFGLVKVDGSLPQSSSS